MLSQIPAGLEHCPLTKIDASDNHLIDLPNELAQLSQLTHMNFNGNNLPADVNNAVHLGIKPLKAFLIKRKEDQMYEKNKQDKLKQR
ncbi:hypothetical protein HDU91_006019 [Kappamyces sp. JEL0680]|nr:hypothetical protein HDU91_006019 [Kappamyces sp. JEL0680]